MGNALPYRQRDEFDQELLRRQWRLRWEAIQFLQLMYSAANGSPHQGIEGEFIVHPTAGPLYVMVAENQPLLAKLLNVSDDGGVRRICRDLELLGIVERKTKPLPTGGKRTRYIVSLTKLLAIPEHDPDSMIAQELKELLEETPFSDRDSDRDSDRVMNHDHEGLNINSFTHDHDHEPTAIEPPIRPAPAAAGPARFDQIAERDLRGIAGFAVEIAGVTGVPNPRSRMRKLREYFADAIAAGHADPGEFALFGALFRHVGRRTDVKHRAKYLRTLWTNRTEKPLESVVTAADREYFRELLRAAPEIPELAGHACGS